METVLRTQGLCKHYRRFQALDGLDMEVPKGAIYGLVGKNCPPSRIDGQKETRYNGKEGRQRR